jgi:hypothetical protein
MVTAMASVLSSWSGKAVGLRHLYTAGELEALHTHLVLKFRSMVNQHSPGCAFVVPYPSTRDVSPNEILVIPARSGAALFSIGFLQAKRTTMVVRIGEHGVLERPEDNPSIESLAATAELLFSIALYGRYREESWAHTRTGRHERSQSYFLDVSQEWQELGPSVQPPAPVGRFRHQLTMQERRYEPY